MEVQGGTVGKQATAMGAMGKQARREMHNLGLERIFQPGGGNGIASLEEGGGEHCFIEEGGNASHRMGSGIVNGHRPRSWLRWQEVWLVGRRICRGQRSWV